MEKLAQKRSFLNKLREKTNITGVAAEKYFSPELTQVMEILRKNDNAIRATIAGEAIEGVSPALEGPGLKETLKKAKSNFNRREYLLAIYDLSDFHKKATAVNTIISDLNLKIDQIHYKFFIEDDDESRKLLQKHKEELAERFTKKKASLIRQATLNQRNANIKQAGIKDFLHNIGTQRGRALAYWEKKNPKEISNLKDKTDKIINDSQVFLDSSLKMLEDMASARATRSPGDYQDLSKDLAKVYSKYHLKFEEYYEKTVKSFLEKIETLMPQKEIKAIEEAVDPNSATTEPASVPELSPAPVAVAPAPAVVSEPVVAPPVPAPAPAPAPAATGPGQTLIDSEDTGSDEPLPEPPSAQLSLPFDSTKPSTKPPVAATDACPCGSGRLFKYCHGYTGIKPDDPCPNHPDKKFNECCGLIKGMQSAANFVYLLESLSGESPTIIASVIKKYANNIKQSNPVAATKLLKIASKI